MDILIPELSESASAGTVVRVSVKQGDKVTKGQTVLELETEKAVLEVPSPADGIIAEVLAKAGDKVQVGQKVFVLSSKEGGAASAPAKQQEVKSEPPASQKAPPVTYEKMQQEQTVHPTPIKLNKPSENEPPKPTPPPAAAPAAPTVDEASHEDTEAASVPAAPSVRRLAREIGVNIADVKGSGEHGRISIDDVKQHAKALLTRQSAPSAGPAPSQPLPDFAKWGEISREPMSAIRKATMNRMAHSWTTIPHVTQFSKADITELDKLRQRYSTPELKLTITPFVIKVLAAALRNFPKLNASIDPGKNEVIYKKYINIGAAVDTDHGLLVPVIRDADRKNIMELAQELKELAEKARARKLTIEQMQGGTFTVTNLGGITGGLFTPIVNWPEVAILGISRAELEPSFKDGAACFPRLMLPLALSYDHRLVDGADGARFIKWVCDAIEQPFLLELK